MLRFWLGSYIGSRMGARFPYGTLVINITGSFILGLFVTLLAGRFAVPRAPVLRLVIAIGFVGAYTTFSTFGFETLRLLEEGATAEAFRNALGTLITCAAAAAAGIALAAL